MPLAPRLSLQSAVQLVLAGHIGLLLLIAAFHRQVAMNPQTHWSNDVWLTYRVIVGGFFVAQIALVAGWAGVSRSGWSWRAAAMLWLIPVLALAQATAFERCGKLAWWGYADVNDPISTYIAWMAGLGSFAGLIFLGGVAIRWIGYCLVLPAENSDPSAPFTLKEAALLTALVASLLATGRWLVDEQGLSLPKVWQVVGWTLPDTADSAKFIALAGILAAVIFSPLHWRWILCLLVLAPVAFGFVDGMTAAWLVRDDINTPAPWRMYKLFYSSFALMFVTTLLVFRDRGFRWRWNSSKREQFVAGSGS